jgi:hypothetical protein
LGPYKTGVASDDDKFNNWRGIKGDFRGNNYAARRQHKAIGKSYRIMVVEGRKTSYPLHPSLVRFCCCPHSGSQSALLAPQGHWHSHLGHRGILHTFNFIDQAATTQANSARRGRCHLMGSTRLETFTAGTATFSLTSSIKLLSRRRFINVST